MQSDLMRNFTFFYFKNISTSKNTFLEQPCWATIRFRVKFNNNEWKTSSFVAKLPWKESQSRKLSKILSVMQWSTCCRITWSRDSPPKRPTPSGRRPGPAKFFKCFSFSTVLSLCHKNNVMIAILENFKVKILNCSLSYRHTRYFLLFIELF